MFFCSENNCGYIIQVCEQIKRISLKFTLPFCLNNFYSIMYNSISQERINLSYNTRNIKKRNLLTKWIPKNIFLNYWISLLNYSLYSLFN